MAGHSTSKTRVNALAPGHPDHSGTFLPSLPDHRVTARSLSSGGAFAPTRWRRPGDDEENEMTQ
jgi:hypothetical protein